MAAMRFEQVQRFILVKKIFWGYGHSLIHFSLSNARQFYLSIGGGERGAQESMG